MTYLETQFYIRMMHAQRAQAEIVSGAYRLRKIYHGTVTGNGPELTDEEKLEDKVEELNRHIQLMDEIAGNIYKEQKAKEPNSDELKYFPVGLP